MGQSVKYIVFLGVNIFFILMVYLFHGAQIVDILKSNFIWGFAISFVLLGVLLGYFISLFLKSEKEQKGYFFGQVLSSVILVVLMIQLAQMN